MERVGLLGDPKHPVSRVDKVRIALLRTKEVAAPIFGLPFAAFGCSPKAANAYRRLVDRVCHRQIPKLSDQALVEAAKTMSLTPYLVNDPTRQLAALAVYALSQDENPFNMFELDDHTWDYIVNQRYTNGQAAFELAAPHLPPKQKEVLRQLLVAKWQDVFTPLGRTARLRLASRGHVGRRKTMHLLNAEEWEHCANRVRASRRVYPGLCLDPFRPAWQPWAHKILSENSLGDALHHRDTHCIVKDYPKTVEIYEQAFARAPNPALKPQLFRLRALAFGIDLPQSNGETVTVVVTGDNETIELQVDRAALDASCRLPAVLANATTGERWRIRRA